MSSYDELIRNLTKNKVNNPVFSCFNFSNNKKIPVDSKEVIKFYKEYSDNINDETDIIPTLGEVSEDNIPIISEFIFKFEQDEDNEENDIFYNKKIIHGLIICHHKVIRNLISLTSSNAEYICVANESKFYKEGNLNCIKLNLRFPYCCLGKDFIRSTFRNKLLTQIRKAKLEKYFTVSSPMGDWSSHLQDVKDIYTLYGSSESNKIPPALLVGVFGEYKDGICKNLSLEKAYNFKNHHFIKSGKCNIEDLNILETVDEEEDNHLLLLPIFTSVYFYSSISNIKINNDNISDTNSSQSEEYEEKNMNDSDLEISLELIDMLKEERFVKENYFIDIGAALYNATNGSEEGLKIWMRLGLDKQIEEDEEYYEDNYDKFDNSHITIKTLGWYAKKDNPDGYKDWHKKWCLPKLRECVSSQGAHVPVAEAFFRVFWLDYIFSRGKWYSFSDHTLKPLNEVIPLRNAITNGLIPYFQSFRDQTSSVKNETKGDHSKNLEAVLKEIKKIIKNLYTESYRSCIINSSQTYFWKENISKILNKNPYLVGMKNGVIELTKEKAFVRDGKPEDFITKKIGVRYKHKYNYEHKDVKFLLLYLRQVFPENSVNHHMKKDIASFLFGRNKEKKFRVWIGDTNGSKSIYQKIIRTAFGDYYCDLPPEYYSAQQKSGNGPNPELAQTEDAHMGFSAEPDDDMSIKAPRIKKITGGDSYFVRNCNQDGGSIETTFKPILVLNNVPDVQGMEEATKSRFSMVPYEGRWLRPEEIDKLDFKLPDDIEEQIKLKTFVMDGDFDRHIPNLANALLWLSVQYYKIYIKEGLKDPIYMQKWMNDYWKKNDSYTSFIAERLENPMISKECKECKEDDSSKCSHCYGKKYIEEIDVTKSITASELYPEFKRWFYETYPNKKKDQIPDKKKFTAVMSNKDKLKPQNNRRWYGVVLRKVNGIDD